MNWRALQNRGHGFTLIEVMLAMVLLALLMAGVFGSIRTATKAIDLGDDVINHINRMRVAQEFVRHQVSRTLPLPFGQDESTGGNYTFEGSRDSLRFVAPMPGYLSHGGPYVQTLQLSNANTGMQLIFTHTLLTGFDLKDTKPEQEPVVLLDQIQEGHFEFRTWDEQGKLASWSDKWDDPSLTPVMVRLLMTLRPETRTTWPDMEIPLMIDVSATRHAFVNPRAGQLSQPGGTQNANQPAAGAEQ